MNRVSLSDSMERIGLETLYADLLKPTEIHWRNYIIVLIKITVEYEYIRQIVYFCLPNSIYLHWLNILE